jgi:GDP-L-fucose synthase
MLDLRKERILVSGGSGFLGRALLAALKNRGVSLDGITAPTHSECDLLDADATQRMLAASFGGQGPTLIIHCAGFIGGLGANRKHPGRFFHDNLAMGVNLIEAARQTGLVDRRGTFVQLGTMCSYGANAPLPYREEDLFKAGLPDGDFAPYGIAKLTLLQMLDAYRLQYGLRSIYLIPTNLYGPGNNMDPEMSHAAGALIRRFVDAADSLTPGVICWGSGAPLREFLYVDDCAEALLRAAEVLGAPSSPPEAHAGMFPINLSSSREVSMKILAETIARLSGYQGRTIWDASKGDGVPRRSLDPSRAAAVLGWRASTPLEEGLARTIAWYRAQRSNAPLSAPTP